jgi:signal transduction histidine kinase
MRVRDDRFEEELGGAAPLVAAVFDSLPDAIGIMWPVRDDDGAIVDFILGYTNPSAERLMGVPLSREVGTRMREAMPGLIEMGMYDRLVRAIETGEAEMAEIELDTMWRDTVSVRGVWVHSVLPFGEGVLSAAFDVTEERRREHELREFAAVAAHDLREPLIGVHLMAGLLSRRPGLGEKEREMVGLVDDGIVRARDLVDGILEYATAHGDETWTQVDTSQVVVDVLSALATQVESTAGRVEVGELPVVDASQAGLFRVFQNLIANALKFRGTEPPRVEVRGREEGGMWHFSIADNGIGIDTRSAERVFEMFQRLHTRDAYPGTGVGLAIVKKIVVRHGGRIWVQSREPRGTIFHFTLADGAESA